MTAFVRSFVRSFVRLFVRSPFIRLFVRSFVHLFVRSSIRSFVLFRFISFIRSFNVAHYGRQRATPIAAFFALCPLHSL